MTKLEEAVDIVYDALALYLGYDECQFFGDDTIKIKLSVGDYIISIEEE